MFSKIIHKLRKSLLWRLTIVYAVALSCVSSIGFLIVYYRIYSVTIERMDLELREEIEKYAALMTKRGEQGVRLEITKAAETEDSNEEFHRLLNFEGDVLVATDMSSWGSVDKENALVKLRNQSVDYASQTIAIPAHAHKARVISAIIGPALVLQLGESLEEADEYLAIFRTLLSILIITVVIVSAIIGRLLARRALIDMQEVTDIAEEITKGSHDRRVQIKGQFSEIERLGAAFNKMVDRIQSLLKSMKEINDNIAHDLRSPLARIRGLAEMGLLKEKSMKDYKEMAASTVEECDALIGMVNTMLDITEAEAGVNDVQKEEFDLVGLIVEACELFRPTADEKRIELKTHLPESLAIRSQRKRMQRIVTNLLENAIKYTLEDGTVAISAAANDGEIQIDVEDTGIGIAASDLPHIFERFYRCDRSRSQGGVGLGLSLVQAYTGALNGTIRVKSTIDQGSHFSLRFVQ